jgi:hypothetical protein
MRMITGAWVAQAVYFAARPGAANLIAATVRLAPAAVDSSSRPRTSTVEFYLNLAAGSGRRARQPLPVTIDVLRSMIGACDCHPRRGGYASG